MTADTAFQIVNNLALVPWLLLVGFRSSRATQLLVRSGAFPALFSLVYVVCLAISFSDPQARGGSFFSLEGVRALFRSDWGLLAGWVHYIVFDLLAGVQVDKMMEGRNRLLRLGTLILTLMLGPAGWLVARALSAKDRKPSPAEMS